MNENQDAPDKNANILKVVELGIQDRVYEEMKQPRFSVESLTRKLNTEGVQITSQSIRKFIKKTKQAQQSLIRRDINAANELKQITMDYGKELKAILKEVEEVKNSALVEKDYMTYNQLVGRIMQGLELIAKLTGDIKPKGNVDINFIYNEINNNIENDMKSVRSDMFNAEIIDIDAEVEEEDKKAEKLIKGEDE